MNGKIIGIRVMRILAVSAGIAVLVLASVSPSFAGTRWNVGVSGGDDGISGFHLSIGEFYRVPRQEIVVIHKQGICDEELPVVFFIAQKARVRPDAVARLRLRGMTWMDITLHYGLSPDIYLVHNYSCGRRHHHPGKHYRCLSNRDIVNQVNLIFLSGHHRCAPDRILKYRSQGRSYVVIDRDFTRERHQARRCDRRDHGWRHEHKKDKDHRSDRGPRQDNDWKDDRRDTRGNHGDHGNSGNHGNRGSKNRGETHREKTQIIVRAD